MKRITLCAAALFAAAATLAAADLPKAETILDKYIEVTGGKSAYEKTHSEITTGSLEFVGKGIKGQLTVYRAEPDKSYSEVDLAGVGKIQEGSDGKIAWSLSAIQGPHLKEGEEKTQTMLLAKFNPDLHWRDLYKKAETAGIEQVDGKDCYKVVLTPNEGVPMTRFYDKQSNLLVKMMMTVKTPMGEFPVESALSDYRKEGDILMPHKLTQKVAGQEMATSIESVKYNAEIPKDKFEIPEEIKALMKK
jgi:outer membrane lipoprotein-sorting protein